MKHLLLLAFLISAASCADVGTRENPYPMGTTATFTNGWQFKVLDVIPNANEVIAQSPLKEGYQYFITKIEVKNNGSVVNRFNDFDLHVVGASSEAYDYLQEKFVKDYFPYTDIFPGSTVSGNISWIVNSSDIDSLVMYYDQKRPYIFFSLKKNGSSPMQNVSVEKPSSKPSGSVEKPSSGPIGSAPNIWDTGPSFPIHFEKS